MRRFSHPIILFFFIVGVFLFRTALSNRFIFAQTTGTCNPPADYRGCANSSFGTNGVALMDSQYTPIETDFAKLRDLASQSNPATANQRLQATIILGDGTIADHDRTLAIFHNAEKYGIDMTIRTWGNDIPTDVAQKMGSNLSTLIKEYQGQTGNTVRIELGNEPNLDTNGTSYSKAFAAFAQACTSCAVYLPSMGGTSMSDKEQFIKDFTANSDAVKFAQQATGIVFNSYADTPRDAVSDWVNTVSLWEKAGINTSQMRFFLTETGPSDPFSDRPNLDQFLAGIAQEFKSIKNNPSDPLYTYFQKLDGLTYFIWDKNQRLYLYYIDEKGNVKKSTSLPSSNVPGELPLNDASPKNIPASRTEPYRNMQDEFTSGCWRIESNLNGGSSMPYYRTFDKKIKPEMRKDGGFNWNTTGKRGVYCGVTKSDPIMLRETAPFTLKSVPQCKTVEWMGEIQFNYDNPSAESGMPIAVPFAQEIANQIEGDWSAPFVREDEIEAKGRLISTTQTTDAANLARAKALSEIQRREGVLKKILSIQKQDEMKCDVVDYVRAKGSASVYSGFTIYGRSISSVTCPPNVTSPKTYTDSQRVAWESQWGKIWSKLPLVPNEKTMGDWIFAVCDDRLYHHVEKVNEVTRMGLAINALWQALTPMADQEKLYKNGYEDMRRPLKSATLLGSAAGGSKNQQQPSQPSAPVSTPAPGPTPPPIASSFDQMPIANAPFPHPAEDDVQENIQKRGWEKVDKPKSLVCIGYPEDQPPDNQAPQVAAVIGMSPQANPVDYITNTYRILDPGGYGGYGKYASRWEVSLLGLKTTPGQDIFPANGVREIGGGNSWLVLYAQKDYITLINANTDQFDNPLENNAVLPGYVVHIDGVAVNPDLLASYQNLNARGRGVLPALRVNEALGKAIGDEVRVSVRDSDDFMDVRSKLDWWAQNFPNAPCVGASPDKVQGGQPSSLANVTNVIRSVGQAFLDRLISIFRTNALVFAQTLERVPLLAQAGRLLAQSDFEEGCGGRPVDMRVEVVNTDPNNFDYALVFTRNACSPQGTLGDLYINPPKNYEEANPGKTGPHVQSMTGNELRFLSTYGDADGFMPRVHSIEELNQYVWLIDCKSFPIHHKCDNIPISFSGAIAPPGSPGGLPPESNQCDTALQCCVTRDCPFKMPRSSQLGPSDTGGNFSDTSSSDHELLGVIWDGKLSGGRASPKPVKLTWEIPAWHPGERPLPAGCQIVTDAKSPSCGDDTSCGADGYDACNESKGLCGAIMCTKVHDRVVDVYNSVPFLDSAWKQLAGAGDSTFPAGVLSMFKPSTIKGTSAAPPSTGCTMDPAIVFDNKGNFTPVPGAGLVTYTFDQGFGVGAGERNDPIYSGFGKKDVTVVQVSPANGKRSKVLFYRLGGLCNATTWISRKVASPIALSGPAGGGGTSIVGKPVPGSFGTLGSVPEVRTSYPDVPLGSTAEPITQPAVSEPVTPAQSETIAAQVSQLVPSAPKNETPRVTTVTDPESARQTICPAQAAVGDKVVTYEQSRQVIVYRPSTNSIVCQPTLIKKAVRNGSGSNEALETYANDLMVKMPNVLVVEKKDAKAKNYEHTFIIDVVGYRTNERDILAKQLDILVGDLPQGEVKPDGAQFLIILGSDWKK